MEIREQSKGPLNGWFGLKEGWKDGVQVLEFDGNLYWSVMALFKYFGTCGVEEWDKDLIAMKKDSVDVGGVDLGKKIDSSTSETKRYTGYVIEWRRSYGYVKSFEIVGKIFVRKQNMDLDSADKITVGSMLSFLVGFDPDTKNTCVIQGRLQK